MFTPPTFHRIVPPEGPKDAKIAIIGEAPGAVEDRVLRPFQGPAGRILDECLHASGLIRSSVYITNFVKVKPEKNDISAYWHPKKGFTDLGLEKKHELLNELNGIEATVLVPMGNVPLMALIGRSGITKLRGYVFTHDALPGKVIIPAIHPAASLHGKYLWRYYIMHDLMKARRHSEMGARDHWPKRDIIIDFTFNEACEWIEAHRKQPIVSFDIEVINYEVSCISLTSKANYSISIPFYGCWSEEEERHLWSLISKLLYDERVIKVGQNLAFDMSFLIQRNRIITRGYIQDTMVGHSVMYPNFEKSLEFIASIYTDSPYWKDMVSFKNIKKES